MGPNSKVIAPSIVNAWGGSSTELTAALAIIQTSTVVIALIIMLGVTRRLSGGPS
jgi:iron(III) transport system permease protein